MRAFVDAVLARGRLRIAIAGVSVATAAAAAASARLAEEVRVQDLVFGEGRSPLVGVLIGSIGVELTSTVVYLLERSFGLLVLATALTPLFIWLLGATAIHAGARLLGARAGFRPVLVLFGYGTALTRLPAEIVAAALGSPGRGVAQLAGAVSLAVLGVIAWRGVQSHYRVSGERAVTILALALVLFYVAPLLLILASLVAILIAALVLDYFPR